ncbi:MAG TPA: PfkB family carbohydrate kinase [Myxococcales bacterium]|nr:PfkB family carbohydrate kinase [Myxococcales bacterium]
MPLEVLFAGHYCHDTVVDKDGTQRTELGGAAAYASAVLLAARVDFRVAALVGDDFRYVVAKPPRIVAGARTTVFIEDYRGDDRTGTLVSAAPPLEPDDLGDARCQVGMACAIAGEIGAGTLERLRELSGILIADAQGFVRGFDAQGRVFHRAPEPALRQQIDRLDWLKLSRSETEALDPRALRCGAIVTDGDRGCLVLREGREVQVPAFTASEVDPTGAGDCFLAGFAVGLLRGRDPIEAARFASFCGALAVAQAGVPRLRPEDLAAFSAAERMS